MKNIADILQDKIEQIFIEKGLTPLSTPDDKILVIDDNFISHYKLDINYNRNDFSCVVLKRKDSFLSDLKNFNIPWTNGEEINSFLKFLKSI